MHATTARVRYGETDQAGVAYHGSYLAWCEVGRTEMLRDIGHPYGPVERDLGVFLTVVRADLRYQSPARFDDLLRIESRVGELRRVRMRVDTKIMRDGGVLCEAELWLAAVDRSGRPVPIPGPLKEALARTMAGGSSPDRPPTRSHE
jgi:acyl-CoA thioester hydrolase